MKVMLVAGGSGFAGSNFIKYFLRRNRNFIIVNIDRLTVSGNSENLMEVENSPRYHFIRGDVCNYELVNYAMGRFKPDYIVNFAAEIPDSTAQIFAASMVTTNITGTLTLLESARSLWSRNDFRCNRFVQISTDEVYGSLTNDTDYHLEEADLRPESSYAASKAGADLMVQAYSRDYRLPAIITRSCNIYGPYQAVDKLIPRCIVNAFKDKPINIREDAGSIKEWLHVQDHSIAVIRAVFYGKPGEIYNIGSGQEASGREIVKKLLKTLGKPEDLVVEMREAADPRKRSALNSYKARNALNWSAKFNLDAGLKDTIYWYDDNKRWWKQI